MLRGKVRIHCDWIDVYVHRIRLIFFLNAMYSYFFAKLYTESRFAKAAMDAMDAQGVTNAFPSFRMFSETMLLAGNTHYHSPIESLPLHRHLSPFSSSSVQCC